MAKTAKKTNEKMWKSIVASVKAGSSGGRPGQWSARKAQIATKRYKKRGGGYKGAKSSSNRLSKWSKQKWDYVSKGDEKSQELREVVIYLNQLGRVSVPQSVRLPIGRKDKLLPRVSKELNTVKRQLEK